MAKKNFKGGLDSLIENSLGMKRLKSRKGEMKGNPIDLETPDSAPEENNQETENEEVDVKEEKKEVKPKEKKVSKPKEEKEESLEAEKPSSDLEEEKQENNESSLDEKEDDSQTVAYLKSVIHDLRHELYLWRNAKIDIQIFNKTLHQHNLKYNPENNEIEDL